MVGIIIYIAHKEHVHHAYGGGCCGVVGVGGRV